MQRRNFLQISGAFAGWMTLGSGIMVGCESVGRPTIVDMMHEAGYNLETASYNGRTGTIVRGFNQRTFAAAGDGPLVNGTPVVIMKVNGIIVRDAFLEDIMRDDDTVIQPMVVAFSRSLAQAG